jgi:serine/threonine protein kinase
VFEGQVVSYNGSNTQLQVISEHPDSEQRRVAVKVLLRFSDLPAAAIGVVGCTPGNWMVTGKHCFSTEVQAAQRCVQHDYMGHVLRVYAVGYVQVSNAAGGEERRPALIMEYAAGGCLREVMVANGGKLDRDPQQASEKAWKVAQRMFKGLWVVSKAMVVHRDCKPDNAFLTKAGDVTSVKLGDFGLALLVYEAGTRGSTLVYTPGYEAPEVVDKARNGTEMDVWLLGCSLLEMLTGKLPFYHAAGLPPEQRKAWRHGGELVRPGSPYCDPTHPDYDQVGRHLTQAERDALQELLQQDPGKRPTYWKVMGMPYMMWGPQGTPPPPPPPKPAQGSVSRLCMLE